MIAQQPTRLLTGTLFATVLHVAAYSQEIADHSSGVSQRGADDTMLDYASIFRSIDRENGSIFEAARSVAKLAKRDGQVEAMRQFITEFAHLPKARTPAAGLLLPILPRLAGIPLNSQAQAAVPLLNSDDPATREAAEDLLIWIESDSRKQCKWEFFEAYLAEHEERPPDYFVNHLMKIGPPVALELFAEFYGWESRDPEGKTLVAAGRTAARTLQYHVWMLEETPLHDKPDKLQMHLREARQAVTDLLNMDRWWTNVVAAEAAKRFERLRTPEIKQRLLSIDDPLVQQRLNWARASKAPGGDDPYAFPIDAIKGSSEANGGVNPE